MRAIDTHGLLRLLARDDARPTAAAEACVAAGAWVSHLVLAEAVWVLAAVYDRRAPQLIAALEMLLAHKSLVLQEVDTVAARWPISSAARLWAFPIAWCGRSRARPAIRPWAASTRR